MPHPYHIARKFFILQRLCLAVLAAEDHYLPAVIVRDEAHGLAQPFVIIEREAVPHAPIVNVRPVPKAGGYGICKSDAFHYGYVFDPPFLTQQEGRFAGTPLRTLSGGQFLNGYSDHYPTYIIISQQ